MVILEKAYISEETANELKRWIENIPEASAPIKVSHFSDAILECLWDIDQITKIEGRGNNIENQCHIKYLELQAAFFCLKAFCKNKTRLHVLLKINNTTVVAYIKK